MSGDSLGEGSEWARGPESPLHRAVEVKNGLHWRPQEFGDGRAIRDLPRRATHREWIQAKRKILAAGRKARGQNYLSPLTSDMETRS